MATKSKKFSRTTNFTKYEEELLIALVKRRRNVIECKATDGSTVHDKTTAWQCLTKDFNTNSGGQYRTLETLRRKYDNIKKRTKKKYADEKMKRMGTGGGPYEEVPISKIDSDIKDILGSSMTGLPSRFDDDNDLNMSTEMTPIDNDAIPDNTEPESEEEATNGSSSNYEIITIAMADSDPVPTPSTSKDKTNWSRYTPKMLHHKKAEALQHKPNGDKTGKALENKLGAWTSSKMELVDLQKQCFLEKHQKAMEREDRESEARIKTIEEEHRLKMGREDRESEARLKATEEEHQLRMEILLLQKNKYE